MRGVFRADWDGLYHLVRKGDSEALVTLRNQAIPVVATRRVARYSSIPPWQREELAEESFDSTEPAFPQLETWAKALAYMGTTMDRLIFRTSAREHRIALEDLAERLTDPEPARRVLETDTADLVLQLGCILPEGEYQQFRALLQACWGRPETRQALSRKAAVSLRTWARGQANLLLKLRKSFSEDD